MPEDLMGVAEPILSAAGDTVVGGPRSKQMEEQQHQVLHTAWVVKSVSKITQSIVLLAS